MTFHQDSGSSHNSKHTVNFLKDQNIKFIPPDEWMQKSQSQVYPIYWYSGYTKTTLTNTTTFWSQKSSEGRMARIGTNCHQQNFEIVGKA
ncbi:hypothetical protein DPMN_178989 [Dreissena polymorpha]|uniref:Uncharacterized protein n=1 Tax=Dreissena polymorpha TaxID=45954 RepID=A0A9D4EGB0_DREPO|nr:hypothetical protein DPMN_178989 [Dreissena polymorpha]